MGLMLAEITHNGYRKGYRRLAAHHRRRPGHPGNERDRAPAPAQGGGLRNQGQGDRPGGRELRRRRLIQGNFFRAANAAAAWKLPWIGVIENNGYQIWVRAADAYGIVDLAQWADGYGIEGRVDRRQRRAAVYNAARYAVAKAWAEGGPTIIECKTYRWYDHYGAAGAKIGRDGAFGLGYRSDRELRGWMAKDPIARFRNTLTSDGVLSDERAEEMVAEVRQAVEQAAQFAQQQPVPKPEDGLRNVFAQGTVPLHTS